MWRIKSPINNIQMKIQCGKIDNRLKKRKHLDAASRVEILKGTQGLVSEEGILMNTENLKKKPNK